MTKPEKIIILLVTAALILPLWKNASHGATRKIKLLNFEKGRNHHFTLSPDGTKLAIRYKTNRNKYYIQINEKLFGPHGAENNNYTNALRVKFSPDSTKFTYVFVKEEKFYINGNGIIRGPFDGIARSFGSFDIGFTEENSKLFYSYMIDKKTYFHLDRKEYQYSYQDDVYKKGHVTIPRLRFKKGEKEYILFKDKIMGPFDRIHNFSFLNKNQKLVYRYTVNKRDYVVINNAVFGPYDRVESENFYYNDDASRFVFLYEKKRDHFICFNGNSYGPFKNISGLRFNEKLTNFALITHENEQYYVNTMRNRWGPYQYLKEWPVVSDDGTGIGFVGEKNDSLYGQVNSSIFGPFNESPSITLGNRKKFMVTYKIGDAAYNQVNKKKYGPFDRVYGRAFNKTGSRWAFSYMRREQYFIKTRAKRYGPYKRIRAIEYNKNGVAFKSKESFSRNWHREKSGKSYFRIAYGKNNFIRAGWYIKKKINNGFRTLEKWCVDVYNRTYCLYDEINDFEISETSKDFIFSYMIEKKNSCNEKYVRYNNLIMGPYYNTGSVELSSNGKGYAFIYDKLFFNSKKCREAKSNKRHFNGCRKPYQCFMCSDKKEYVRINNKTFGPYKRVLFLGPVFSGDGLRHAFTYSDRDDKTYVNFDNKIYGPFNKYWEIKHFTFEKGHNFIMKYRKGKRKYLQVNHTVYGPCEQYRYIFTEDKLSRVVFLKDDGYVYIDDVQ